MKYGKKSFIPPALGKIDGTDNNEASHNKVGCPSNNFVAVTTAFDSLMMLATLLLSK